jgi:hypothetical protein
MSGVSIETLGVMLVSSIFVAECALSETSVFAEATQPARGARQAAKAQGREADQNIEGRSGWSAKALLRAERMRAQALSRCLIRARARCAIRIQGRR